MIPVCPLGVVKIELYAVSFRNSVNPQLIEIATTPGVFRAVLIAVTSAGSVCELASTTRMFAPGAIACAPLDVERFLERPAIVTCLSRLVHNGDCWVGQPKRCVERLQIRSDVRVVVGLDQSDGLARAISLYRQTAWRSESDCIERIGGRQLCGCKCQKQAAPHQACRRPDETRGHGAASRSVQGYALRRRIRVFLAAGNHEDNCI